MRILLISRHFLDGTSEGLCAARAAAALVDRGHELVAVVGPRTGSADDAGLAANLGKLAVHSVPAEGANRFERFWSAANQRAGRSVAHRAVSAALNLRRFSNGAEWTWVRSASEEASRLVSEGSFDVMFSRLNPAASHHAARAVAHASTVAWCASFSDPWPHFLYPPPFDFSEGPLARRRGVAVARSFAHDADALLFPGQRLARWMAGRLELDFGDKCFVAPHCGPSIAQEDAVELADRARRAERERPLLIRHAGFLMSERRLDGLFEALSALPEDTREGLRFEFMGRRADSSLPEDLASCFAFHEPRSPAAALEWLAGADVLLLVESSFAEGIFLPSKVADYSSLPQPMLAISPRDGEIADLVGQEYPLLAPQDEPEAIRSALELVAQRFSQGDLDGLSVSAKIGDAFSPTSIAVKIEEALEFAVAARRSRG